MCLIKHLTGMLVANISSVRWIRDITEKTSLMCCCTGHLTCCLVYSFAFDASSTMLWVFTWSNGAVVYTLGTCQKSFHVGEGEESRESWENSKQGNSTLKEHNFYCSLAGESNQQASFVFSPVFSCRSSGCLLLWALTRWLLQGIFALNFCL